MNDLDPTHAPPPGQQHVSGHADPVHRTRLERQHETAVHEPIGRAIHDLRSEQGYSLEAFALQIGVDPTDLGTIERGEFNLTADTLFKIAAGLGVSVPELLARTGL